MNAPLALPAPRLGLAVRGWLSATRRLIKAAGAAAIVQILAITKARILAERGLPPRLSRF